MGRKHGIPTRECVMKNLKKLSAKLDDSPCCQIKAFPCCTCTGPVCFQPTSFGHQCYLVPNSSHSCCSCDIRSKKSCGPFPPSCDDIFSYKPRTSCAPIRNSKLCQQNPTTCFGGNCQGRCCKYNCYCCKPKCFCNIRKCPCRRHQCNRFCMPTCHCRSWGCTPTNCYHKRHCRCSSPCSFKFRNCRAGNLCCRCNTICLPRSFSDTTITRKNVLGKSLRCSKSVELRGGILYRGCDCDKRNGLQDRCLRYCCINNPKCKLNPAKCHCSKFSCGKHLSKRYSRRKCNCSYTCYVCKPRKYMTPLIPCYPETKICCCRKQTERSAKKELGCQCCPSMQEAQCLCSLCSSEEQLPITKHSSVPPVELCCMNASPCPSHRVSPCPSPCSVKCPPSCFVPQSTPCQEQFCSCCSASCQRTSPITYHTSSNSHSCLCGQRECICNERTQFDPKFESRCVSCKSPCHNDCNYS
ncbi:hypothetical protein WA026_014906 [Henosepilachna vigintioctopunctata]|uniref:Uncharacterized protein n=1 Tax=Henosepilachna vigintioctopunctata TaxID=420089 RepID=A0AAW1UUF3_9CUCU